MEQNVEEMVAVWPQLAKVKVQIAVGEHRQWAVGLVTFHSGHRSTPKVVLEHLGKGGF